MLYGEGLDAKQLENSRKFDLQRPNSSQHLSFGIDAPSIDIERGGSATRIASADAFQLAGCIGSMWAKMQACAAIGGLLQHSPGLDLSRTDPVTYSFGQPLRLATSIPIEWRAQ